MNLKKTLKKMMVVVLTLFVMGAVSLPVVSLAEASAPAQAEEVAKPAETGGIAWKPIAAAIAIVGTAFATAVAQMKIGGAGAGAIAERPETAAMFIVLVAIPETIVILGFVVAAMLVMF